jgi:hypothetical protein
LGSQGNFPFHNNNNNNNNNNNKNYFPPSGPYAPQPAYDAANHAVMQQNGTMHPMHMHQQQHQQNIMGGAMPPHQPNGLGMPPPPGQGPGQGPGGMGDHQGGNNAHFYFNSYPPSASPPAS